MHILFCIMQRERVLFYATHLLAQSQKTNNVSPNNQTAEKCYIDETELVPLKAYPYKVSIRSPPIDLIADLKHLVSRFLFAEELPPAYIVQHDAGYRKEKPCRHIRHAHLPEYITEHPAVIPYIPI